MPVAPPVIRRRHLAGGLLASALLRWGTAHGQSAQPPAPDGVQRGRVLQFPRDHGAHLGTRTEWWYATGWLQAAGDAPLVGFQVTFFRHRTGLAETLSGRLAPRQLLFAHAAVCDLSTQQHLHADRLARWSGASQPLQRAHASVTDTDVSLGGWRLRRQPQDGLSRYEAHVEASDFAFSLALVAPGAPLLQGDAGFSRKGPEEHQASHYVTEPQLQVRARVRIGTHGREMQGRAWLDHEWSDELLHPQAVGWDWIGMNLLDGRALTAFQLRRADGSALWTGGSLRAPGSPDRAYADGEVRFGPGRRWRSPGSQAAYPVEWQLETPAGRFRVRALLEAQELDSRASTGTLYWEGLSELLDDSGRRAGLGYLEMTGYAGRLRL